MCVQPPETFVYQLSSLSRLNTAGEDVTAYSAMSPPRSPSSPTATGANSFSFPGFGSVSSSAGPTVFSGTSPAKQALSVEVPSVPVVFGSPRTTSPAASLPVRVSSSPKGPRTHRAGSDFGMSDNGVSDDEGSRAASSTTGSTSVKTSTSHVGSAAGTVIVAQRISRQATRRKRCAR